MFTVQAEVTIGELFMLARLRRKDTIEQMAEKAAIQPSFVQAVEDDNPQVQISWIIAMADVFDWNIDLHVVPNTKIELKAQVTDASTPTS